RNAYFMITLIVLLLSLTFAGLTLAVFSIANTVDQTSVGFIYLGNYDEDQFGSILTREINTWKQNADYRIEYQDYTYVIDLDISDFDLNQTLSNITRDQDNQAYFIISSANHLDLQNEIIAQFTSSITSTFNMDVFLEDLLSDFSDLRNRKVYNLVDYLDDSIKQTVINQSEIDLLLNDDVENIISEITSIQIYANERFSLLDKIGDLPLTNEQMSIIASGIQSVAVNANFSGFIFEQNYTLPVWAGPGQNVRILKVNQFDFTFFNNFDYDYQIEISKTNDTTLEFSLIGYPLITSYSTVPVFQVEIPFQTIYIDNENIDELTPGVIVTETDTEYIYHLLIQAGVPGQVDFFVRTETRLGEAPVSTKLFDEETLPINAIYYENIVEK
ncbi:MAG: hypothetical protein K9L02_03890, partial [Acholeplasmataceae bacterium]|nr:hypothetical protein [Acholeplasmataceae bacterium]